MERKLARLARRSVVALIVLSTPLAILITGAKSQPQPAQRLDPGFHAGRKGSRRRSAPDARFGSKRPLGNGRFHTYVFQQRLGVLIDLELRPQFPTARGERFKTWGIVNYLDRCTPGLPNCPTQELGRDVRLRLLSRGRRSARARRDTGVPRSGLLPLKMRLWIPRPRTGRRINGKARAISPSAPPRERSASGVSQSAFRC